MSGPVVTVAELRAKLQAAYATVRGEIDALETASVGMLDALEKIEAATYDPFSRKVAEEIRGLRLVQEKEE